MKKKRLKILVPLLCMALSSEALAAPQPVEETAIESSVENTTAEENEGTEVEENTEETESISDDVDESASEETSVEESESVEEITEAETEAETSATDDASDKTDAIEILESDNGPDAEGFVTMTFSVADDVTLPVTIAMSNKGETSNATVTYNDQEFRIKPGTYTISKVIDGNGKALDDGAKLTIPEENGSVYLDFNKPESEESNMFLDFLTANLLFIPIAALLCGAFLYLRKRQ